MRLYGRNLRFRSGALRARLFLVAYGPGISPGAPEAAAGVAGAADTADLVETGGEDGGSGLRPPLLEARSARVDAADAGPIGLGFAIAWGHVNCWRLTMFFGEIKENDIANGAGVRTTLFVSGCRNHCRECFQPQTWSFSYGQEFTDDVADRIIDVPQSLASGEVVAWGEDPQLTRGVWG